VNCLSNTLTSECRDDVADTLEVPGSNLELETGDNI
jgi:hypothetical protein